MSFPRCAITLAFALVVSACSTTSPKTFFYTLSAGQPNVAERQSDGEARTISLWQLTLPELVDRSQMVVRVDPNQVEIADFHRWAEPLRRGIPRVLAENLAQQLGPGYRVVAGQPAGLTPQMRVLLDVQKFDATLGEGVVVEALWSVRGDKGETRTGQASVIEPAEARDHAAIAAAYSRALARLSREIAGSITAPAAAAPP